MEQQDLLGRIQELAREGRKDELSALIERWDKIAPNQVGKSPIIGFRIPEKSALLTKEEADFYAEVLIAFESLTSKDKSDNNYLKVLGLLSDFILSDLSRREVMTKWNKDWDWTKS